MNTSDINIKLVDSYLALCKNMSIENKLELISKLTQLAKKDIDQDNSRFYNSYGEWDKFDSAEEIIRTIKESRTFSRTLEEF